MRFLGRVFRSTTFLVVITLVAITASTSAYLLAREKGNAHSVSGQVSAGPMGIKNPASLQVVMGSPEVPEATDAEADAEAGTETDVPVGTEAVEAPAGADGAEGPAGADGAEGPAGADGAAGPEGPEGPAGPAGSVGATGPAGSVGATGPAGVGLTAVDGGGYELRSPDGISYRIAVTNNGIIFQGPTSTEVWSDTSHFRTLVP